MTTIVSKMGWNFDTSSCRKLRMAVRSDTRIWNSDFEQQPCSFLEVLIGLSRRLAFNAKWEPSVVGLATHQESGSPQDEGSSSSETAEHGYPRRSGDVIWRTYKWDGDGRFLPAGLSQGRSDQS